MIQPTLDLWPGQLVPTTHYDDTTRQLADRHYNRQTPGARQFAGNGRKMVLRDSSGLVMWIWLKVEMPRWDGQRGYYCQSFRNETDRLSSEIILEAERHATDRWGPGRMFTYVDPAAVRSDLPGYCYLRAGWHAHGWAARRPRLLLVRYDDCAPLSTRARLDAAREICAAPWKRTAR